MLWVGLNSATLALVVGIRRGSCCNVLTAPAAKACGGGFSEFARLFVFWAGECRAEFSSSVPSLENGRLMGRGWARDLKKLAMLEFLHVFMFERWWPEHNDEDECSALRAYMEYT